MVWAVSLLFSHVQLFVTPWTLAHQAPLFTEFSKQEYWSGLPFPSPGDLPGRLNPGLPHCRQTLYHLSHQGSHWFPLGLTGLISLQAKGLSRVFSSTTVWKHQFFGVQPSLWSNFHIHTQKTIALTRGTFVGSTLNTQKAKSLSQKSP